MQLDVDAIVSRDVCLCALRVESNNRIQGAPVFFSFYYSSLLVEPFPSHSLLASKCNTRLNQTPIFFLSIDDEGRQNKKKKDGTGRYWVLHLEERNCQFACLFSTRRRDDFFLFFLSYFSIQSTFFFTWGLLLKWLYIH